MGIGIIGVSPICSTIPNARSTARVMWLVQRKHSELAAKLRYWAARISYIEVFLWGMIRATSATCSLSCVHLELTFTTQFNRICIDLVIYTTYPNLRDTASLADYSPKLWQYARCADRPMALRARI